MFLNDQGVFFGERSSQKKYPHWIEMVPVR